MLFKINGQPPTNRSFINPDRRHNYRRSIDTFQLGHIFDTLHRSGLFDYIIWRGRYNYLDFHFDILGRDCFAVACGGVEDRWDFGQPERTPDSACRADSDRVDPAFTVGRRR